MEYDNDRIRRRNPRRELFYWVLLALLYPLSNGISAFSGDAPGWLLLLLVSGFLFPVYLIYSRIMGTVFFIQKRGLLSLMMSLLSFLVVQVIILTLYSLLQKFDLRPVEQTYFSLNVHSFIREGWWTIVNMTLAAALFFIRRANDEKGLLETAQKESHFFRLRYLRAQLNPHFLFNTLNSIYSLALQKSDRTPEMVIKLADIMRYLIYECNEETILLDKEIEFIRNYIEIEKIRYKADIRFTIEGDTTGVLIEPFLFISFIENGFKHALDNSFAEPFIYINLKVEEGQIVLNVINSTNEDLGTQAKRINGKGISHSRTLLELLYPDSHALDIIQTEKEASRTSSLRIKNARERLESLYPDAYTLDVILSNNAFTVSLILKSRVA
jgi:two-component system LytT family sensor kinase